MNQLFQSVSTLKNVAQKRTDAYKRLGINTVYDLLYHIPRQYRDFSNPVPISELAPNTISSICVTIRQKLAPVFPRHGLSIFKAIAEDNTSSITIIIYNNHYAFDSLQIGKSYFMFGKTGNNIFGREILSPHIIPYECKNLLKPIYPLTTGLTSNMIETNIKQALEILEREPFEWMPKNILDEHHLLPLTKAIPQLHFPKDNYEVQSARRRLAFDELLQLQLGMLMLRNNLKKDLSQALSSDVSLKPFFDILPFKMTDGQFNAVKEICKDLCKSKPMNRLLQGDVGSGKTAVAAACAYFAIKNNVQCALMAPTEILARQHYQTFKSFLEPFGISVELLVGSQKTKEKRDIRNRLETNEIQMLIGTHAIFQKDVVFSNLSLVITDEQHRFGVEQRSMFAEKGGCPHKLVMSATPIPRTLALLIYGDLDISILKELPNGRKPIETYAVTGKLRQRAYSFIKKELLQGRQAYIVCPTIDESEQGLQAVSAYSKQIQEGAFSEFNVGLLHGKLSSKEKDAVMTSFQNGEYDILVSTTVIEVGIDVPNATVMLIEDAERFGLSQLHQLRGRVGRGKHQSYCILVTEHVTDSCRQRLQIMSKTRDGFVLAEEDLKMRGPGDFFGERQHGLPLLKVADMTQDMALIQEVQDTAKKLLKDDPTLMNPENRGLRLEVLRLFAQNNENGMN